jgi:hypothetical protein
MDGVFGMPLTPEIERRRVGRTTPVDPSAREAPMATPKWQVSGEYFESCSCDYVCPCIPSNMAARPTHGDCYFAMAFRVERGRFGDVALDEKDGSRRSVSIPGVLDQAVEGVASPGRPNETLVIDNTLHPANARLALAKATRSHLSAFGLTWDDTSGRNNGHFAPFAWQG